MTECVDPQDHRLKTTALGRSSCRHRCTWRLSDLPERRRPRIKRSQFVWLAVPGLSHGIVVFLLETLPKLAEKVTTHVT
ncbi:hypothetical protein Y1Q_0011751 [Alligator mississippiensis]|uniref:Uncharacterized protein n=1 Tax=Alligator mississippiensis TaxID=8496 RepID=A0A151M104_ALLMI|nr:hypothetical protein Y1Q_0011751 [Alligator mississippiensis]